MGFDNAYEAITEEVDDHRWAFGTGFADPLAGVDTTLPEGIDGAELAQYCLMLGDDALVMSHRLQQWLTRAPELEEETALANVALDLLGQTRLLYSRAGAAEGAGRTEDDYAYLREERDFRNVWLVEGADEDFAELTARLLVFSAWRLALLSALCDSRDPVLSAIAAKGMNEVAYHRDYAAQWVVRLGDGTPLSHDRMQRAFELLWPYAGELFAASELELRLASLGVAVDPSSLRADVDGVLDTVFAAATLARPGSSPLRGVSGRLGRDGVHTEAMGYVLAELQSVARAYPGATW